MQCSRLPASHELPVAFKEILNGSDYELSAAITIEVCIIKYFDCSHHMADVGSILTALFEIRPRRSSFRDIC